MAKILDGDLTYVSFPITKFEEDADGNLVVRGTVSDGSVDSDKQIVDPTFSGKALTSWMSTGPNVRVMHSPALYPAGRGLKLQVGNFAHDLEGLVVEDTAKKLVRNKVLRAWSIGIANPVIKRDPTGKAPGGIVVGGEIAEVSLVDRPANKNCQLVLAKSADNDVPWTYGDIDRLLAEAEALNKGKKPQPEEPDDEPDTDMPDHADSTVGDEPDDDEDMDEDSEDVEGAEKAAYAAAVRTWRASEPKRDGVALSGTAFLAKRAAWQRWADEGDSHGLDGTETGYRLWVAKRNMDPNVGGGVDRDKIPAADFVDQEGRRFPIVKPGDVSDAVSSFGRAKPPIPMPEFKQRLTAIARRKGPAFVAQLPDSWSKDDEAEADLTKDITLTSPDPDGLVPYNLQGQADKGAKACRGCGQSYDADSKMRRCEGCGRKLPKARPPMGKSADDATLDKGKKRRLVPPDVDTAGEHREPDGTSTVEELEADAGLPTDPDGTSDKVPASVGKAKDKKGKGKPFPGAAEPFGAKPDSDGDDDADEPDDDQDNAEATATKGVGPYSVRRMHDALCAAYDWGLVRDEYPALKSVGDAMMPAWFAGLVPAATAKGDIPGILHLAELAQSADVLAKGLLEPALLADARAQVHKAFTDMYPSAHPSMGSVSPGQYQRPYISAGHAPLNAGSASGSPSLPPASHTITPDQFDRGLITEGHEAASPGSQGNNLDTSSVATGSSRTYYTNASRDAARMAMQAMHDHIAGTFPDMCPMAASKSVMPPDNGQDSRPHPVQPLTVPPVPGEKTATVELTKTVAGPGLSKKAVARLIKAAAREAAAQATAITTTRYESELAALRAEIDELGAQPDPAQAPLRGVVRKAATTDATPVEKRSLAAEAQVSKAAQDHAEQVAYLRMLAKSGNPGLREQAEDRLGQLELLTKMT